MKKTTAMVLILLAATPLLASYTWKQRASMPAEARHRCITFTLGNKGYLGLGHYNAITNTYFGDIWQYDPTTNSWSQVADYGGGPTYHATAFVVGNRAYAGTGQVPPGSFTSNFYSYDPVANTWSQIASFPGPPRRGAVSFSLNGYGYTGTGNGNSDFYRYDPINDMWTPIASLPVGKQSAVAFSINGKGYVGTGSSSNDFYEYNPTTNQWTQKAGVGGYTQRQEACGFALNGLGYIGTGDNYSSGTNYGDFWSYNPATNQWTQLQDFPGTARRYMVSFVIGNKAYAGSGTNGTNFNDLWEYSPATGIEETNPETGISCYPMPATDHLWIEVDNDPRQPIQLKIIAMDGRTVFSSETNGRRSLLYRGDWPSGSYLLLAERGGEVLATKRLIWQ